MPYILLVSLIAAAVFGPGLWVQHVMRRYASPVDRYQGSGAELARHLLDRLELSHVKVEQTKQGDHYDPRDKTVRLLPDHYDGHSLTAVAIAAHEVGHAIQDHAAYQPLRLRTRLVGFSSYAERFGALLMMAAPVIGILSRAPSAGFLMVIGGLMSLGTTAMVHLITLPTELDASFARALPLLESANILKPGDLPHARRLLRAAALTYLSASLLSLLNVARWWAIIRR